MSGPWDKYQPQPAGPWAKYGQKSDPAGTAAMNAQSEAAIQGARDEAYVSENPVMSRVNSWNAGLPLLGGWMDEAMGKLSGEPAEQFEAEQDAFSRARPGQDLALRTGAGATGALATLPLMPGGALASAGSTGGQAMSPEQMQQVRKTLQAAAQSADSTEARIGTKMLKEFDGSVRNPLVPEFKEGDALYSRAMRGKEIDDAIKIAGTRRSNTEAALSNEFGSLQRSAIRGDLTYPDELAAAVEKVAASKGGQGVAAEFGRFAPTGPVGMMSSLAAPFLLGTAAGGGNPMMGALASAGAGTIGMGGRLIANGLAKGNAREAAAVARNGAPLQAFEELPESIRSIIAAMLAREGTAMATGPQ